MNGMRAKLTRRNILTALLCAVILAGVAAVLVLPSWNTYKEASQRRDALAAGITPDQQRQLLEAVPSQADQGRITAFVRASAPAGMTVQRVEAPTSPRKEKSGRSFRVAIVATGTMELFAAFIRTTQSGIYDDTGNVQLVRANDGALAMSVEELQTTRNGAALQATIFARVYVR